MGLECRVRRSLSFDVNGVYQGAVGSFVLRIGIRSEHVFHFDLLPASSTRAGTETTPIVAAKGCDSGVEVDTGDPGAEPVAHAGRDSEESEEEEKWKEEQ